MIVDGGDLALDQHQIAHDHDTAMHGLECGPATKRERRTDGDAVESYVKIAARKSVAMNIARHCGASADRFIDFFPVDLLGVGGAANARQCTKCQHVNTT